METDLLFGRNEKERNERRLRLLITLRSYKMLFTGLRILTLSKILCKWKQDSVVSLFLYLNSVFKHKHKLIHNQAPV